jgi:hypothetical protein
MWLTLAHNGVAVIQKRPNRLLLIPLRLADPNGFSDEELQSSGQ